MKYFLWSHLEWKSKIVHVISKYFSVCFYFKELMASGQTFFNVKRKKKPYMIYRLYFSPFY